MNTLQEEIEKILLDQYGSRNHEGVPWGLYQLLSLFQSKVEVIIGEDELEPEKENDIQFIVRQRIDLYKATLRNRLKEML